MSRNAATRWDPAAYAVNAAFVPALGAPVLALLDPQPGERVLDLGCGDGVLTERIVATGAQVVGIDSSPEMVVAAKLRGVDVQVGDGQVLELSAQFDAVFSNAALHWMLDKDGVAGGVFAALRPGGRFVGEMGGEGNVATLRRAFDDTLIEMGYRTPSAHTQWYASAAEFKQIYVAAGFTAIEAWLIDRPTPLPGGARDWFRTFRAGFLDTIGVPEDRLDELAERAGARAEVSLRQPDGTVVADYVRLRFSMRKPD